MKPSARHPFTAQASKRATSLSGSSRRVLGMVRNSARRSGHLGRLLSASLFAASLVVSIGPPVSAAEAPPRPIDWFAPGDSYTSGHGTPHADDDTTCRRSTDSWVYKARDQLGPTFKVVGDEPKLAACTGATTDGFKDQWDSKRHDLLSFSFGGDDIGFGEVLRACVIGDAGQTASPLFWLHDSVASCPADTAVRSRIDKFEEQYRTFLHHIVRDATTFGGHVVVVGYPAIFADLPKWSGMASLTNVCNGVTDTDANLVRGWAGKLNSMIGKAVEDINAERINEVGVTFVNVNDKVPHDTPNLKDSLFEPPDASDVHTLCGNGESWMNGFSFGTKYTRAFHPNVLGHEAEGKLVANTITSLDWTHLGAPGPQPCGGNCGLGPTSSLVPAPPTLPTPCSVWNAADDFRVAPGSQNPSADKCGNLGVWSYSLATRTDPANGKLLGVYEKPTTGIEGDDLHGLERWYDGTSPYAGVAFNNTSSTVNTRHPAHTLQAHPGVDKPVVVTWRSPLAQTVAIAGSIIDRDERCGDGVSWSIYLDSKKFVSGRVLNGRTERIQDLSFDVDLTAVAVAEGSRIAFVIDPEKTDNCDTTGIDVTIRSIDRGPSPATDAKAPASTGVFADGGFEQPQLSGNCIVTVNAGQKIGPWTVGLAGVDHQGSGSTFSPPNQSIDLSALDAGSIAQTFDTVPGTTYSVGIDAAANVVGPPASKTFTMSVDSVGTQPGNYTATKPGGAWCETPAANSKYEHFEYRFTASGATTTLTIASTTAGRFGPVIDNVTVSPVGAGESATTFANLSSNVWRTIGQTSIADVSSDVFSLDTTQTFWAGATASAGRACDYRFEGEARVVSGDGYGFYIRSTMDKESRPLTGRGLQYVPQIPNVSDIELPQSETGATKFKASDHAWHSVAVEVAGANYKSFFDGELQFEGTKAAPCGDLYLRVWRTKAEFRNLRIATLNGTETKHTLRSVPATTTGLLDTGVTLTAGQRATVSASGIISYGSQVPACGGSTVSPNGCDRELICPVAVGCDALIGRLDDGPPFPIGESKTVPGPGTLKLGINDVAGQFADNSGAFTVTIDVE